MEGGREGLGSTAPSLRTETGHSHKVDGYLGLPCCIPVLSMHPAHLGPPDEWGHDDL